MGLKLSKENTTMLDDKNSELVEDSKTIKSDIEIADKSTMLERGIFKANGHTFVIKPILLKEVDEYLNDDVYMPRPINDDGTEKSEKELGISLISIFRKFNNTESKVVNLDEKKTSLIDKIKLKKSVKDNSNYSEYQYAKKLVKWVERKVTIKNKLIKFDELESKYHLTKSEISKMILYLSEISGF